MKRQSNPYDVERRARRIMSIILVAIVIVTISCWLCVMGAMIYGR